MSAQDSPIELVDRHADQRSLLATVLVFYRYRELLRNLVLKDLKLKYRGSLIGFLWSLANPLLMIVVYTVAFTYILRIHSDRFVFFLMLGLLPWTFFANSAGMSTGSIADNGGLIKGVYFPRAVLPVGSVLFNLTHFVLTMLVFLPLMLVAYRVPLSAPMLAFPLLLLLQVMLTVGVAISLAVATTFFRDVRHLLEVVLSMLFWATPILYDFGQVPRALHPPLLLNPMTPFIVAYHQVFYYGRWPDGLIWILAVVYAAGALALGARLLHVHEHELAERI